MLSPPAEAYTRAAGAGAEGTPRPQPRLVALGGGTGLPVLLAGLKAARGGAAEGETDRERLTAIVTVADDGGSSGRLRRAYGMLPPGDIRNCLLALSERGGIAAARAAVDHPTMVYAHAKAAAGAWRWYHLMAKFPLFALAPTAVLFNAHQHIAYGGPLGEYYLYGLGAYLETFAIYRATVTTYCVLYASVWRGLAEGVALLAAHVAPSRAARVRRAAEIACRVLYYGGVPVLLALRFAPW